MKIALINMQLRKHIVKRTFNFKQIDKWSRFVNHFLDELPILFRKYFFFQAISTTLCQVTQYLGFKKLRGVDRAYYRTSQILGHYVRPVTLSKISPFRKNISFIKSSATLNL
jgi:hypothetical protein